MHFGALKPAVDEKEQDIPHGRMEPFKIAEWEAGEYIFRRGRD